jgi:hypothetical protein
LILEPSKGWSSQEVKITAPLQSTVCIFEPENRLMN